jgi:glycosyltransferase involved in cell wall biosynthesis
MCFALYPELVQPQNQRSLAKNTPRFIKQSNYIVTVSESARRDIINYYKLDPAKVIVAYNGVNSDFYRLLPQSKITPPLGKYGLKYKKYFLFVSNIEPRKNVERLIQAMAFLPKEYALMLVGSDGWLNDNVFKAMKRLNQEGRSRQSMKVLAFHH